MNEHVVLRVPAADGYETDFSAWALAQSKFLRERRFGAIDIDNLAEEVEELARSDEREVVNRLKRIVEHMLKLLVSIDQNPRQKWRSSIVNQRDDLDVLLSRNPSLSARRAELFQEAWWRGLNLARTELAEEPDAFAQLSLLDPEVPSLTVADALNPDFFPGD